MAPAKGKRGQSIRQLMNENEALRAEIIELKDQVAETETEYLLANPANRDALLKAIAELDAGMGVIGGPDEGDAS